jgi:quinohemoprotein ethanol dehydrogenase
MFVVKLRRHRRIAIAGALAALGLLTGISAQQGGGTAPLVDTELLKKVGTAADALPGSWLAYGRSQTETRYSPLKLIDTSNVNRLGLAWSYVLGAGGGKQEATPLVWNNTLYGITNWSVVYAVDARTGKDIWRWDPEVNQTTVKPCCGASSRGIAIYRGMIIAPVVDGRLIALDALTGKPIWETRVAYPQDLYTITMAPRVANGKVVVGVAGGDRPTRGFFDAYDVTNGHRAWRFYTVPGDPSKPYENEAMRAAAKTWGGDFYTKGGGGAVWDGIAYDADANLVYVGTGNAEPWVQKFRGAANMDNLYTCSILAVDLTTGQLKWHYQTVPNDNWDFDSVQQLMLLNLTINGRERKVITQAAKNGFFYVLDRVTGEFISASPFVKVNWATGFDEKGRPMVNPEAFYDNKDGVEIFPTGGGAHNWAPMSYNPNAGLVYIPASYSPFLYQATDELKPGTTGYVRPSGKVRSLKNFIGPVPPEGVRAGLQAWDPVNRKLAWRADGGGGIGGGTSTTAGNLVFQTLSDGHLRAFSADKGAKLFEIQVGRTGLGPPITYEAGGVQYVAFQGGSGRPANVVGRNDATVDSPPILFVFRVDGKAALPKPAPVENNQGRGGAAGAGAAPAPAPDQTNH